MPKTKTENEKQKKEEKEDDKPVSSSDSSDQSSDSESETETKTKKTKKSKDIKKKKKKSKKSSKDEKKDASTSKDPVEKKEPKSKKETSNPKSNSDELDDKSELEKKDVDEDKNKKAKSKNANKDSSNHDNDEKNESKIDDKKNNEDEPVSAGTILDILSKLRLQIAEHRITSQINIGAHLEEFADNYEVKVEIVEKIDSYYEVWKDVPNNKFYLLNKVESNEKKNFTTVDDLLLYLLDIYKKDFQRASTILREPKRVFILEKSVFDPEALGFPHEEMMDSSAVSDDTRRVLSNLCRVPKLEGGIFKTYAMEHKSVSDCRDKLIEYSRGESARNIQNFQDINDVRLDLERQERVIFERLDQWTYANPIVPFNAFTSPFDDFELSAFVRSEYISHVSSPDIVLDPIPANVLIKASGSNTNRATFLTDFIASEYKEPMGPEIAMYICSLINPGDIMFDIEMDIGADAIEKCALVAMITKVLFMYQEDGIFSNISRKSLIQMERMIASWGKNLGIFQQNAANDPFPLNNVRVNGRNNDDIIGLDPLRTTRGRSGIIHDIHGVRNDEIAQRFYRACSRRMNYAVNLDDYDEFENAGQDPDWPAANAIFYLLKLGRMPSFASAFIPVFRRLMEFFIRWNEYMKVNWHNCFRQSLRRQNAAQHADYAPKAIPQKIKATTLMYLVKSLPRIMLKRKIDYLGKLKFEASFCKKTLEAKVKLEYIERFLELIQLRDRYSTKALLDLAFSDSKAFEYLRSMCSQLHDETPLRLMLQRCEYAPFTEVFDPLTHLSDNDMILRGILPKVIIRQALNRWTPNDIRTLIDGKELLTNFSEDRDLEELNYINIMQYIREKSILAKLYSARSERSSLLLKVYLPYHYNHVYSNLNSELPISIRKDVFDLNFRKKVELRPVSVTISQLDEKDFRYEDDYVNATRVFEGSFIPSSLRNNLLRTVDEMFANPRTVCNRISVIRKTRYSFASGLVLAL